MLPLLDVLGVAKPAKCKRILQLLVALLVAAFACPLLIHFGRFYLPKLWGDLHLLNYIVAWIPAVLSVLVAFVPDRELELRMRIVWRVIVILCGFIYSVTLWRQQALTDMANAEIQRQLLKQAITEANTHSDQQFGTVNSEVSKVGKGLDQTRKDLVSVVQQTSDALGIRIGTVGMPEPPRPAKLTFSLWDTTSPTAENPTRQAFVAAKEDGTFPFDFTVINGSEVTAKGTDIWLTLCQECTFAQEPSGFERPSGTEEQTRHMRIGDLNPGVSSAKTTVLVKAPRSAGFVVAFSYSCENCGGRVSPNQLFTITHTFIGVPSAPKSAWQLIPKQKQK